jgi:hypothetical protein
MNNNTIYNSILSDIDDNLHEGDVLTDPFGIFDVYGVEVNNDFLSFFKKIDLYKLRLNTNDMDIDWWTLNSPIPVSISRENTPQIGIIDYNIQEYILRFAWYVCKCIFEIKTNDAIMSISPITGHFRIPFEQLTKDLIDMSYNNMYAYDYATRERLEGISSWITAQTVYYFNVITPNAGQMVIKHKKSSL